MRISRTVLVLGAVLSLAVSSGAVVHQIEVGDTYFSPSQTHMAPGDTVQWVVVSGSHIIEADDSSPRYFNSGLMDTPGQSFEVVFHYIDGPGPFPYHCDLTENLSDTIFSFDECSASYDNNSDGYPLTVADLIYFIRVANGMDPAPDNLYQFDITGDCVVDAADADLLTQCVFLYGIAPCLPIFPVPTCCYPSTDVGACCVNDSCSVRSAEDCAAVGGVYHGEQTTCLPDSPCSFCVLRGDANHDGVIDVDDLICLIEYQFCLIEPWLCCQPVCMEEIDVNGDGAFDISDMVSLVSYMFGQGPEPAPCPAK